jgi:hypothetical protein
MLFQISDPEAFWLDVTNIGLGVVCAVCFLALAWAIGRDAVVALRRRAMHVVKSDAHALSVPELGLTMADGGSRVKDTPDERSNKRSTERPSDRR